MTQYSPKFVHLNEREHSDLKYITTSSYQHLANINNSSILVEELSDVVADFPVVFLKDPQSGAFQLTALFGLVAGENLFVADNGDWTGHYLPTGVAYLPFSAFYDPNAQSTVRVDINSNLVTTESGTALFTDNEPSELLKSIKKELATTAEGIIQTQQFIDLLINKNLLCEFTMELKNATGETSKIEELYTINRDEFNYLSEEDLLQFHKLNYWNGIYLIEHSLTQLKRVIALHNIKNPENKVDLTMSFNK